MELKSKRVHPTLPTLFVARNFNVLKEPTSISNIFKYYLKDFFLQRISSFACGRPEGGFELSR